MLLEDISIFLRAAFMLAVLPRCDTRSGAFRSGRLLPLAYISVSATTLAWGFVEEARRAGAAAATRVLLQPLVDAALQAHTILLLNCWKRRQVQRLFDAFADVDRQLHVLHHVDAPRHRGARLFFGLVNAVYVAISAADYVAYSSGFEPLVFALYACGEWLTTYCIHISESLKALLLWCTLARFRALNAIVAGGGGGKGATVRLVEDVFGASRALDDQIRLHARCADLVTLFNDVYGWNQLASLFQTIVYIMLLADVLLSAAADDAAYVCFLAIWTAYSVVQAVAVTAMCEQVADEGKRTMTLAYRALARPAIAPAVQDKLLVLAQQAAARRPRFSAAGFFDVDFAMLFTFVNLITTYVIVIIQFSSAGCSSSPPAVATSSNGSSPAK